MANNFMEARTEIEGYITKMDDVKRKIAGLVVEACEGRASKGNINNLEKDIKSLLDGLSESDKNDVLTMALTFITKRSGNTSRRRNNDDDDDYSSRDTRNTSNLFRNRGF